MTSSVFVFDPTAADKLSSARGVGRYLQILKEVFSKQFIFTDNLRFINQNPPSIFINPFFNLLQPPLLMRRIAKKQIAIIHDLIPLKYSKDFPAGIRGKINIFLNKLALKNYHLIITDSQASKKDIIQILKIDKNRVRVVYPCLPKIFTEKKLKAQNLKLNKKISDLSCSFDICDLRFELGNKYCLYVGDATWNKNLVNLARAIKIVNVTCLFVGKVFRQPVGVAGKTPLREADGGIHSRASQERRDHERQNLPQTTHPWQKELKEFLELTKDDKRFVFAGFVSDETLIKLYQHARVNILISRDEGFGFSYLEAASCACPSVLSNIPVLKEIVNGDGEWFADPNDPNDIANKIGEIYFNNNLRNKLGLEAQQRANFFSEKKFRKEFLSIIKSEL